MIVRWISVLSVLCAAASLPLAADTLERPIPGEYRGMKQCLACHELSHYPTHHEKTIRPPTAILTTKVDGETVSIFDPRTPGYETYVAPFSAFFNAENVLYTIGGHGFMQRFLTRVVPADGDARQAVVATLEDNDMVVMGAQWNQRRGRWEDFHGPTGDDSWGSLSFNTKCGSCHATGFMPADKTRLARWVDLGITCEACHGPSSELNPLDADEKLHNELCGSCHTRGVSKTGEYDFPWNEKLGGSYKPRVPLDSYITQVAPDSRHFWNDGESRDHHQQWPDYQLSRHNAAGIRCTECHHQHRNDFPSQLRDESVVVCLSCHNDTLLNSADRIAHSKHTDRQATCVDCHMPRTARAADDGDIRSHTFFMIEPQRTREFGIRSGCVDCHTNGPGGPKTQREIEEAFLEIAPSYRETTLIPGAPPGESWTGFALANLGKRAARLLFTLFDPDGRIFERPGVDNPRLLVLGAGEQTSYLADEFFGAPLGGDVGWVRLSHYQPGLRGFYLEGNAEETELQGLALDTKRVRSWVTPVLWPGSETRLSLTNLSAYGASLRITPMSPSGARAGDVLAAFIPERARRKFDLAPLFPSLPAGGYVSIESDVELEGQVTALQGRTLASARLFAPAEGSGTLTLPHVAQGGGWETRLTIYNPLDRAVEVQIQMRRDGSGSLPYGGITRRTLAARAMMNEPLASFIPASSALAQGYVLLRTTDAADRIQAAVAFGSTGGGAVAALGADARGRKQITFSHVAQRDDFWTGLALFSPTGGSAVVELRSAAGALLATRSLQLGDRVVGTIDRLLGVTEARGGYIQIRSADEVFALELFGNSRGTILAAVPPQ